MAIKVKPVLAVPLMKYANIVQRIAQKNCDIAAITYDINFRKWRQASPDLLPFDQPNNELFLEAMTAGNMSRISTHTRQQPPKTSAPEPIAGSSMHVNCVVDPISFGNAPNLKAHTCSQTKTISPTLAEPPLLISHIMPVKFDVLYPFLQGYEMGLVEFLDIGFKNGFSLCYTSPRKYRFGPQF